MTKVILFVFLLFVFILTPSHSRACTSLFLNLNSIQQDKEYKKALKSKNKELIAAVFEQKCKKQNRELRENAEIFASELPKLDEDSDNLIINNDTFSSLMMMLDLNVSLEHLDLAVCQDYIKPEVISNHLLSLKHSVVALAKAIESDADEPNLSGIGLSTAFVGKRLVGLAIYHHTLAEDFSKDQVHLDLLCGERGKGAGGPLMNSIEKGRLIQQMQNSQAQFPASRVITLEAARYSPQAHTFYSKRGFIKRGNSKSDVEDISMILNIDF